MVFRKVSGVTIKGWQEQADTVLLERKKNHIYTLHGLHLMCLLCKVRLHILETAKCISELLCLTSQTHEERDSVAWICSFAGQTYSPGRWSHSCIKLSPAQKRESLTVRWSCCTTYEAWLLTKQACNAQAIAIKTPGNLLLTCPSTEDALSQWELLLSEQTEIICLSEALQTTNWGGFDILRAL